MFPNPRESTPEGLVAVGGQLEIETVLQAYEKGIFPWPAPGMPLLWFSPDPRGVLDFKEKRAPKSFQKWLKQDSELEFTMNQAFAEVVHQCRITPRPGQEGTWILPEMELIYSELQKQGHALSLEAWKSGQLVGGIYGVLMDQYFSAESMFYRVPNASKACLWNLIEILQKEGLDWMDIQMVTDVTKSFGGKWIPREEFLSRIGV